MSFAQITRNLNPRYVELEEKLVQEWQHPQNGIAEPVIIMEAERQQAPTHLYVIWSEWKDMSMRDRSKLILNAYERAEGRNFALNVAVALGLTPEEARKQGIEYAPVDAAA
ncbi:MAG: hypothetical protein JO250_22100 [Armatimonadetes bacterium]|nr:hypothetical protein [Armatimonadota bacterium]